MKEFMVKEKTLVLIKPDAMQKGLHWQILNDLEKLELDLIAVRLVKVDDKLAEEHYLEHKGKPFFEELIKYIKGEFHGDSKVIVVVYEGEDAISKVRKLIGETNPEKASPDSLRGKYGRINKEIDCFETVIHASDSVDSANREIPLWFELVD